MRMAHDRTQTPRPVDVPTPGLYASRFVKGGPWVACRISETDGCWTLYRNGAVLGEPGADPWRVHYLMEWINFSRQISEAEYLRLLAAAADSMADPTAPVDLANSPPLYRRKETP